MVDECIARRKRDMEKLSVMAVVNSREREIEMMEGEIEREREELVIRTSLSLLNAVHMHWILKISSR